MVNGHGSPALQHLPYFPQVVQVSDGLHVIGVARGESANYERQTMQIIAYSLVATSLLQYPMNAGSVEVGARRMKRSGAGVVVGSTPKVKGTLDSIALPGAALGVDIMVGGFGDLLEWRWNIDGYMMRDRIESLLI